MTTTADAEADAGEVTAEVPAVEGAPNARRLSSLGRRTAARLVVVIIVGLVAVFLVEDPIAHVWYQVRQQHLVSTFATARPVHTGDPVAVIQIPAQGINVAVVQGDGPGQLRSGPAHRPSSPIPGDRGNSIVFGHNSGWGGPFQDLSKLKAGDNIYVRQRTANGPGSSYFFRVTSVTRPSSGDRRPFARSDDFRLTLVTAGSGGKRLVVTAVSGAPGHLLAPDRRTTASSGPLASSLTWPVIGTVASIAGLAAMSLMLRRRPRGVAGIVAAVPLLLLLLLGLVLIGDTLFRSPLA